MTVVANLLVRACVRDAAGVIGKACLIVAKEPGAAVIVVLALDIGREPAFGAAAQRVEFFAVGVCLTGIHRLALAIDTGFCGIRAWLLAAAFCRLRHAFAVHTRLRRIGTRFLFTALDALSHARIVDAYFIRIRARLLFGAFRHDDAFAVLARLRRMSARLFGAALRLRHRIADTTRATCGTRRRGIDPDAIRACLNKISVALRGSGHLAGPRGG